LPGESHPIRGIRYVDGGVVADGAFPGASGLGVCRFSLHRALAERAAEVGAELRWGVPATGLSPTGVGTETGTVPARFVVGADGFLSQVRRWAGLAGPETPPDRRRFGVRRHYALPPWTDRVEVHWGPGCEAYVTPVSPEEIGIAMLWSGPARGFDDLLG